MSKLQELKEFQKTLDADPTFVDVKFYPGSNREASDEEIAADALVLLKGTADGEDISDEVL